MNNFKRVFLKQILLHPEFSENENFIELLEFLNDKMVENLLLHLKDFYSRKKNGEFQMEMLKYIEGSSFNLESKEFIANSLFQYNPKNKIGEESIRSTILAMKELGKKSRSLGE